MLRAKANAVTQVNVFKELLYLPLILLEGKSSFYFQHGLALTPLVISLSKSHFNVPEQSAPPLAGSHES
jgi:hypothetical protein